MHQADLATKSVSDLAAILRGHDAVINTAGLVTEGQGFVDLVGRIVSGLESLPEQGSAGLLVPRRRGPARSRRPWSTGSRSPPVSPRRTGRIAPTSTASGKTALDWRVLCPGPMVHQQPLGLARMRIIARPGARTSPLVYPISARTPGIAFLRLSCPRDDRLVCRCRRAHARQPHAGRRDVSPSGRIGAARRDAGQEAQWAARPSERSQPR